MELPRPSPVWVTSGSATAAFNGNTLNIQQTTDRATLDWDTFNVSADGQVIFNQPSRTSIALNRIHDQNPSRIFGQVTANGEIYLYNPNGIIFGRTAKINAAGILATTLNISDETFATGVAAQLKNGTPALQAPDNRLELMGPDGVTPLRGTIDADGNIVPDPNGKPIKIQLTVQQGAQLSTTGANGRILLAAQNVDNAGSLTANDGQIILAAGDAVYLEAGSDPTLRGLTVEVAAGGTVWNRLTGQINTPRGNATLVGYAVNQDGRISATTSVSANGSIRLLARDSAEVTFPAGAPELQATRTGTLEFGSQSVTSVLPDLQDTSTAVDDQAQVPSHIEAMGHQVTLKGGSVLRATGGRIDVSAVSDPRQGVLDATDVRDGKLIDNKTVAGPSDGQSQLRVESGAVVDVSGSDATLPMSRNLVSVELRGSELADSPDQRDGALRGQSVVVDVRVGTPLGDVKGAVAAIPKSIAERTSQGGEVVFLSDGDVLANAGSNFNVSGGTIHYEQGVVATSRLIGADGKVYDIGSADPARTYVGLINPVYRRVDDRWGQIELINAPGIGRMEAGYSQGSAAGTLQFIAPTMILNGSFLGNTLAGPYQRSADAILDGGRFILGLQGGVGVTPNIDYRAPSVEFAAQPATIVIADGAALPSGQELQLPTDYLHNGFTRTEIYSNGSVTVPKDLALELTPGSSFSASGQTVSVLSNITNAGGEISLTSHDPLIGAVAQQPGIVIGDGVTLDVRGTWTNDSLLDPQIRPTDPLLQNGGSISLILAGKGFASDDTPRPATLTLGDGVQLRASGGAAISRTGELTPGAGGSISLQTNGLNSEINIGKDVGMDAFGVLGAKGGAFSMTAPKVAVGEGSSWAGAQTYDPTKPETFFQIGTALFSDYGFSTVKITAARNRDSEEDADILRILPGTHLDARVQSLQLDQQARNRASGATIEDFSSVVVPQADQRAAADISFAASLSSASTATNKQAGDLNVAAGAELHGDPGTHFSFTSLGNAYIDGTISAAGGVISAGVGTPDAAQDEGFIADQRLQIGSSAVLDVSGTAIFTPNDAFLFGHVVDGGTINLASDRGSVLVESGARLDVSGTSATLDVATGNASQPYARHVVASSGGSLVVRAPESIGLYGDVDAFAGTGDTGKAAAGSLVLELTRQDGFKGNTVGATFPTNPRILELTVGEVAGSALPENGTASISQEFIKRSGADSVSLRADDEIAIRGGVDLSLARQLTLDTARLSISGSGDVSLAAPYVAIGNTTPAAATGSSITGNGKLEVQADFIDIIGSSVLSSMARADLHSNGDIRLRGTVRSIGDERPSIGDLTIAGDLSLTAARVYGSTDSEFTLQAGNGANGRLEILQGGASPGTPLSVGASITLIAPDIVQGGTLLAPFGSISLQGSNSVSLLDGSETSVSGNGTLFPYGRVSIGDWTYVSNDGVVTPVDALPARQVAITSDKVTIATGAVVDISGGGDLYAYEWVPGTGGTKDALAPGVTPGLYAILPSLQGQYAPYDPQEYGGSDLAPGQSVYLSGIAGLPAGVYPLLPARYALLPGAYLISSVAGTDGIVPGSVASLRDGTRVIAGYTTFGNTQLGNTQYSGFAVRPGSYGRALAQYDDSFASSFFAERAARLDLGRVVLPADAGSLSLFAGTQLDAKGNVSTKAASGGRDATIDVSALHLAVVAGTDSETSGDVQISAEQLAQWNPGTLILGGHESQDPTGGFAVTADEVSIGSGVNLAFDQIVIAAHDQVSIGAGATVASRSGLQSSVAPQLDTEPVALKLSGADAGAVIVAVSDLAQLRPERDGAATLDGTVDLAAGAVLASRGAITIDAPGGGDVTGDVRAAGARLDIGANRLVFGTGTAAGAIVIDAGLESTLHNVAALRLAADTIDFQRNVAIDLSGNSASEIELHAAALNALAPNLSTQFSAHSITLSSPEKIPTESSTGDSTETPVPVPPPFAGSARFGLTADTLQLGPGATDIAGFSQSTWVARQQVVGTGAGKIRLSGNLDVTTPIITLASDGDTSVDASQGNVRLLHSDVPAGQDPPSLALGGSFSLVAQGIEDSTAIVAPSGLISLQATDNLLLQNASIDVAGREVSAGGREVGSNGGTIHLIADGNVEVAANSSLMLSGAGDSSAGRLQIHAGETASVAGSLSAQAGQNAPGGSFDLDAKRLDDFDSLVGTLQNGGFTREQHIHVGEGDLVLAAGRQLTAQSVELVADTGSVQVGGTILAQGADIRGDIRLYGATGVDLLSGAQLNADAGATGALGGNIELGTLTGSVDLAPGSVVSAAGSAGKGSLIIRTALNAQGDDLLIDRLGADLSNVGNVTLAPVFSFDTASDFATESDFAGVLSDATAFADSFDSSAVALLARYAYASATPIMLRPDIELKRDGDLTLDSLNLDQWRFDGQAGSLTVRATGSLTVIGQISDGFVIPPPPPNGPAPTRPDLMPGASSSITLVAGADLNGSDPTATRYIRPADLENAAGNLKVESGAIVRTGTGDIVLNAARDIVFGEGASVYTLGLPGEASRLISQPQVQALVLFPDQGGSIRVTAGRDVNGSPVAQSVSSWQYRGTSTSANGKFARFYAVSAPKFGWNLGALGGGDLSVTAGRDVHDLSAATADSATVADDQSLHSYGGGSMAVTAGGDIDSSLFYGARGSLRLHSDAELGSDRATSDGFFALGNSLALGSVQAVIEARRDILLERALNPTILVTPIVKNEASFFTYGDDSSLRLQSAAGDVYVAQGNDLETNFESGVNQPTVHDAFSVYPSSLVVRSFSGDVVFNNSLYLFPSSDGQLDLFAARDIVSGLNTGQIFMSDGAAAGVPTLFAPASSADLSLSEVRKFGSNSRHLDDPVPALVTAGRDIFGLEFNLAKATRFTAGRDVRDVSIHSQNVRATDMTLISAGRDFTYASDTESQTSEIVIGGAGRLDVLAGRAVDLGFTQGISTSGRRDNASLPTADGAAITVMAGLGEQPDYAGFIDQIVATSSDYDARLIAYIKDLTGTTLSADAALAALKALDQDAQRPFIEEVFFSELVLSGREANSTPGAGFKRGYAAVDALFPHSGAASGDSSDSPYHGDLNMAFSRIYTLAGGDISLLIPGGQLNVGLANPPPTISDRKPSELGIVAQGTGSVHIFADQDVLVNSSRVFTLLGGDIAVWSTHGDIDAGRGAKSSLSAPPPIITIDDKGKVDVSFTGAVAGSGIRTIVTADDVEPGNVDLIAPVGFVNAGDAGIGSSGNLNIAAQHVIGLDNIQVGGASTGVPAETGGLGASLAGVTAASSSSANAANDAVADSENKKDATPQLAQAALSWLDVFVVGLGEEGCKQDDVDCLKRQTQ
ncbi:MAG TPA: filamentous hemagglutinin family protein [Steroidobacteraceae bacterium]